MIKCLLVIPWLNIVARTNSTLLLKMPNNKANKALWRLWKLFLAFLGFFFGVKTSELTPESITGGSTRCGSHYPAGLQQRSWQLLLIGIKKNNSWILKRRQHLVLSPPKNQKCVSAQSHFCLDELTAIPKLPGDAGNRNPRWAPSHHRTRCR